MRARSVALGSALALGVAAIVACGAKQGPTLGPTTPPIGVSLPRDAGAGEGKSTLYSLVGQLKDKAIGPTLGMGPSGGIAVWIAAPDKEKGPRPVVVVALDAKAHARGEPKIVAQAGPETTALVVRRVPGGSMLTWTSLTDKGEGLYGLLVDDAGAPVGTAAELTRSVDDIVWMDVIPTPKGAVAVWAEETTGDVADVFSLALDEKGRARGVPSRIARAVTAWQTVTLKSGVGLALVRPNAAPAAKPPAAATSSLHWITLDDAGRPVGNAALVATRPSAGAFADFDAANVGGTVAFAWTDGGVESSVVVCGVDDAGKVIGPVDVAPDRGGASFTALAANDGGFLVAWEEPRKRDRSSKRAHFVALDPALKPAKEATLELAGGSPFELRGAGAGFAVLGMGHPCAPSQARDACLATPVAPLFVRFDAALAPAQVDGLLGGPSLAWSLDCTADACVALAAGGNAPTNVWGVDLSARAGSHRALWVPPPPEDAPRLTGVSTLEGATSISDVAVTRIGTTDLIASITAAADDGKGVAGASLVVRPSDGPKVVLSTKALAMGGVAITKAQNDADGAVVAWVARDNGDPEVHLTRVDKKGAKQNEVQLTTTKGDASDVSIVTVDGGYLVAWVDGRDGNGEVYATRVDLQLKRIGREERLTTAGGDATDTVLLPLAGDAILLAWSDPRESPKDGFADVYTAIVSAKTAKKSGPEVRVLSTAAHSRSPVLARAEGGGAILGWIEEAPTAMATNDARGAMVVSLDAAGKPANEPAKLRLSREGIVTALVLDASSGVLHAVAARSTGDELCLDAIGTKEQMPLLCLDGPPTLDVALALLGNALYFGDDGPEVSDQRLRRALIDWRK